MAGIEVRAVEHLAGSGVAYAYAVKAGPWLFLTGHEAFDFAAGGAADVEGPAAFPSYGAPRLKREAQFILARMRKTLGEFGSDFKHSVRVDQYYPCSRRCGPTSLRGTASSAITSRPRRRC